MTTFDKREEGFEKKFAHDEELRFKANARRNKLLGLWAAEKLGLSGAEADAYAKEVVVADFEEAGDDDVFRKFARISTPRAWRSPITRFAAPWTTDGAGDRADQRLERLAGIRKERVCNLDRYSYCRFDRGISCRSRLLPRPPAARRRNRP